VYGESRDAAVTTALGVIERDEFVLIDRDTVLDAGVDLGRDVVIIRARVVLEGRIAGAVVVAGGEFFTRPGASLTGPVAVIGSGAALLSGLAESGTVIEQDPRVFVSLGRTPTGYSFTITSPEPPSTLRLPGFYGFAPPTYDRVNGLSVIWRPDLGFGGGDTATVAFRGSLAARAARRRVDGVLEASYRPGSRSLISARAGRTTLTADSWIRGDLANSLSTLVKGSDVRDYFESDVAAVSIRRLPPPPLIEGEGFVAPGVTLRISRDRSLKAREAWSLMGDAYRENPMIDEGVLASVVGRAEAGWRGGRVSFNSEAGIEWGLPGPGDFEFIQLSSTVSWTADLFRGHRLGFAGHALVPLGDGEVPRQRWSFVGGPGTLPTFPTAWRRGDHLLFVNTVYLIPVPRIRLPIAGRPSIRLEYLAGSAWSTGDPMPRLAQNVGAGIQFLVFKGMVYANPSADPVRGEISFGAQLSGGMRLPTF